MSHPSSSSAIINDPYFSTPSPLTEVDDSDDDDYEPQQELQDTGAQSYGTPSLRSVKIDRQTLKARLDNLQKRVYGPYSVRCLVCNAPGAVQAAHAIQRAAKQDDVSHIDSLQLIYLTICKVNNL